jgi:hypothetical protein
MVSRVLPLLLVGCATAGQIEPVRFRNQPPVLRVTDTRDIPQPETRDFPITLYMFDRFLVRSLTRVMEVPAPARAANVNALDEVPDSSWFQNRIGVRDVSEDEIHRAGATDSGPDETRQFTITSSKVGGATPGFQIKDARGIKYNLKFDSAGNPEMETAADVIGQRLVWAAGWNTPHDYIVGFRREQLVLAPGAKVKDSFGHSRPMTELDVEATLAKVERNADGSYRALASRWLDGVNLGGYPQEGLREDDPNDRIAHEERRDVRGEFVFFSWIDHTDIKEDNTIDMWVAEGSRHFVRHHLLDFGSAFGILGHTNRAVADGFAYFLDFGYLLAGAVTLGVWRRPWEGADGPNIRGVGRFESDRFEPDNWKPRYPYVPFARMDDFDGFWGARLVMRFSPALLRAAVVEGRFEDPRAVEYLVHTLLVRQRKIGAYWFSRVNPLDHFALQNGALCFDDLWLVYGYGGDASYQAEAHDFDGRRTGWMQGAGGAAHQCLQGLAAGRDHEGYVIVAITTLRNGRRQSPVLVHLATDPKTGALRIIGIRRT